MVTIKGLALEEVDSAKITMLEPLGIKLAQALVGNPTIWAVIKQEDFLALITKIHKEVVSAKTSSLGETNLQEELVFSSKTLKLKITQVALEEDSASKLNKTLWVNKTLEVKA